MVVATCVIHSACTIWFIFRVSRLSGNLLRTSFFHPGYVLINGKAIHGNYSMSFSSGGFCLKETTEGNLMNHKVMDRHLLGVSNKFSANSSRESVFFF